MLCQNCGQELLANTPKDRICQECGDVILMKFDKEIADLEQELQEFNLFKSRKPVNLQGLDTKEQDNQEILIGLEKELADLSKEQTKLEREINDFNQDEFWEKMNDQESLNDSIYDENLSHKRAVELTKQKILKLQPNVYNECFKINTDGPIATINNQKLGRVQWSEVNCALGEIVLLMDCLGAKCNIQFKSKFHVLGDYSRIGNDGNIVDLWASNDISELLFSYKKFDQALVMLLGNLEQLGEGFGVGFPYKIVGDLIGGCSVKYNGNAGWNSSMKYLLVNLQSLLNSF